MTGVVVRVLLNQGFGFVRGEDNIQRFAHRQNFIPPEAFDRLREGVGVTFEPLMHPKGARAEQICVIEGGNR
jgi:cold shock CspA family protein